MKEKYIRKEKNKVSENILYLNRSKVLKVYGNFSRVYSSITDEYVIEKVNDILSSIPPLSLPIPREIFMMFSEFLCWDFINTNWKEFEVKGFEVYLNLEKRILNFELNRKEKKSIEMVLNGVYEISEKIIKKTSFFFNKYLKEIINDNSNLKNYNIFNKPELSCSLFDIDIEKIKKGNKTEKSKEMEKSKIFLESPKNLDIIKFVFPNLLKDGENNRENLTQELIDIIINFDQRRDSHGVLVDDLFSQVMELHQFTSFYYYFKLLSIITYGFNKSSFFLKNKYEVGSKEFPDPDFIDEIINDAEEYEFFLIFKFESEKIISTKFSNEYKMYGSELQEFDHENILRNLNEITVNWYELVQKNFGWDCVELYGGNDSDDSSSESDIEECRSYSIKIRDTDLEEDHFSNRNSIFNYLFFPTISELMCKLQVLISDEIYESHHKLLKMERNQIFIEEENDLFINNIRDKFEEIYVDFDKEIFWNIVRRTCV